MYPRLIREHQCHGFTQSWIRSVRDTVRMNQLHRLRAVSKETSNEGEIVIRILYQHLKSNGKIFFAPYPVALVYFVASSMQIWYVCIEMQHNLSDDRELTNLVILYKQMFFLIYIILPFQKMTSLSLWVY